MKTRLWITGAGGFSGRHLIRFLRGTGQPCEIIGLDCRAGASNGLDAWHVVDLTDRAALETLAKTHPPDRVFHLAGLMPPAEETALWRVNVGGTQTLLHALAGGRKKKVRVLSIGSAAEYFPTSAKIKETHPSGGVSPYGRTKWAQTVVALAAGRELGIDVMVARPFNLVGPGLSPNLVAGSLCAQFAKNEKSSIKVGNLASRRDFVDIRDAVSAYARILERGSAGQIYNVCAGRSTSIGRVVELFDAAAGGGYEMEKDASRLRAADFDRVYGDNTKLVRLGWKPVVSLKQSVQDMLAWARSATKD